MSETIPDDYPNSLVKGAVPPRIGARKIWDNHLQADIFELVIGPFKTEEKMAEYAKTIEAPKT